MRLNQLSAAAALALLAGAAHAGPYIFAGTDADDHGSASSTANEEGWLFMQKSIENLAASADLTTPNRVVYSLGSDTSTQAGDAAASAFKFSSLKGSWTFMSVPTLSQTLLDDAFSKAGIIMLDSGDNVDGGLDNAEETLLTSNASALNSFVGGGGGLFSQAGEYGWLSALVSGLVADPNGGDDGLVLTSGGQTAFPGLSNADLSAGPYHENFQNIGSIPVLAKNTQGNYNVIIGSAGGSITNPEPPPVSAIPEPSTYALMMLGLGALGFVARRRKQG